MARRPTLDGGFLDEFEAALNDHGFQPALWPQGAELLARYGLRVIGSWTASGEIFAVLSKRRIRYQAPSGPHHYPRGDDAVEIANEAVARGLVRLREILEAQGWAADGGARPRTFFITQCLYQFPNVYRRWCREQLLQELLWEAADADLPEPTDGSDPAELVVARQQAAECLRALPDDRLRFAVRMRAEGHSMAEIAATLGVLPKSLENALGRYRRKNRHRHLDHDRETLP